MRTAAADLLFRPRSVVVYGASSDPSKLSGRPLAYLRRFGFQGDVYAVNPFRAEVQGVAAFADVADVPGPVDLAVIVVPAESVAQAVERCAEAGIGAAIVFASGFAEIGQAGRRIQARLAEAARRSGMRILGPNCLGSFAVAEGALATFSTAFDTGREALDSPIALVSQSGAVGTFTFSAMSALGLGLRYFANTGNQADITVVELLTQLSDAPDVDILLGHLEGVGELQVLERLAEASARRGKPLVLLKAGRSRAGSRAIAAHTASEAGDDEDFDQIVRRHGAIRVQSMEDMADTALLLASGRRPRGSRVTIVTLSGGAGALAADAAESFGLSVDEWSADDRSRLAHELPYFASTANPIDVTGAMINDIAMLDRTLGIVRDHQGTDALLVVLGNADAGAVEIVTALRVAYESTSKPMVVSWTGGSGLARSSLLAAGIPTYPDPLRAVRALRDLTTFAEHGRELASLQ